MPSPKIEQFLDDVVQHVKFAYDRKDIKIELENHIKDRIDDYMIQGFDSESAEQQAIEAMGDAGEIGRALNKQHNPVLGWVWKISNWVVIFLTVFLIFFIGSSVIDTMENMNIVSSIPKSNIAYSIDVNKTIRMDDTVLKFTKLVYDKKGTMKFFITAMI